MEIREALTFDDVLLVPAESRVLPSTADTRTRVTRSIAMNIPLVLPQLSVPVGSGLLLLQLIAKSLNAVLSRLEA